jgi:hypothetical protein
VFDFITPDSEATPLGRNLASDLRADLARSMPELSVRDSSKWNTEFERNRFSRARVRDPEIASWLA